MKFPAHGSCCSLSTSTEQNASSHRDAREPQGIPWRESWGHERLCPALAML